MNVREEVKNFILEKNYKGNITEKGSAAEQNFRRLNEVIDIFEQHGITNPTEADFDNILRPAIATKGKKAGESASEKTIQDRLSLARKFYHWIQTKGDNFMNDNELTITATEEQQPDFYPEALNEAKHGATVGRPPKTGRTGQNGKKISLYMTKATFNRLEALRTYDDADMQDLLNDAIEAYFKTRADDMNFLREQEEARRARKARKSQEAQND